MLYNKVIKAYKFLKYPYVYSNCLVRDLYDYMNSLNLSWREQGNVIFGFESYWDNISSLLYEKLGQEDKKLFVRFLLKRFFNIDTILENERDTIDEAFRKAIYVASKNEQEQLYNFFFRDHNILFTVPIRAIDPKRNELERRLIGHYEVTHAFFLLEYEKDGFNPQNGEVILDCGAADGDTAIVFSCLYPDSKIYSFEYGEKQLEYARKNVGQNEINNVFIKSAFLYEKSGVFWADKDCVLHESKCSNGQRVETISIDDFVEQNNIENIGLIKMDIEGGEMSALRGAVKTIRKFRPLMYIPIYHLNSDLYDIPKFLHSLNFEMEFSFKWTEKMVWGVDGVLFIKFV